MGISMFTPFNPGARFRRMNHLQADSVPWDERNGDSSCRIRHDPV
jgi:hypothetical protein